MTTNITIPCTLRHADVRVFDTPDDATNFMRYGPDEGAYAEYVTFADMPFADAIQLAALAVSNGKPTQILPDTDD